MANAFLELLNTPIGTFATQIALLGAAFWGGTGLIKAMGVIPNLFSQFTTSAVAADTALKTTTTTVKGFGLALKTALPIIGLIVAGIQAAIAVFDYFNVSVEEQKEEIDALTGEVSSLEQEYQQLSSSGSLTDQEQKRLNIIKQQIEAKKELIRLDQEDVFEAEWGSPQQQLESGQSSYTGKFAEAQNAINAIQGANDQIKILQESIEDLDPTVDNNARTIERGTDAINDWRQEIANNIDDLNELANELRDYQEAGHDIGELGEYIIKVAEQQTEAFNRTSSAVKESEDSVKDYSSVIETEIEQAQELASNLDNTISSMEDLNGVYDTLSAAVEEYNTNGSISASTLGALMDLDSEYIDLLSMQNGQLTLNSQGLIDRGANLKAQAKAELTAQTATQLYAIATKDLGTKIEDASAAADNSVQGFQNLQNQLLKFSEAGIGATAVMSGLWTAISPEADAGWFSEEAQKAMNDVLTNYNKMMNAIDLTDFGFGSGARGGGGSGRGTSTAQETDYIKEQSEAFKEQNEQLEWNIKMRERQGASEKELIDLYKQLQDQLHQQAEWYRGEGLNETSDYLQETIDGWWDAKDAIDGYNEDLIQNGRDALDTMIDKTEQYINDRVEFTDMGADEEYQIWLQLIQDVDTLYEQGLVDYDYYLQKRQDLVRESLRAQQRAEEEAQEAAEEARQAEIDEIERQIDVYETLFDVVARKAQEEIDALNARRDAVEKYYDDQIAALQKTNEELEKEIQKETLLDNLARARQSQVMVYQDGKWEYVQNIDEISEAQAELEAFERDQALQQEVDNLNRLKDQALASIDAQIEGWEEYKEQWESVVEDYQDKQDELLVAQELGIELEGENWELRLDNMEDYVSQYEALMQRLVEAQQMANAAMGGGLTGSSGGGSYSVGGGGGGGGRVKSTQERVQDELEYMEEFAQGDPDKMLDWIVGNSGYAPSEALDIATDIYNDTVGSGGKKYDSIHDLLEDNDPDYHYSGGTAHKESVSYTSSSGKHYNVQGNNKTNSGYTISSSGNRGSSSSSKGSSSNKGSSSGSIVVDTVKDIANSIGNAIGSIFGKHATGTLDAPGGLSLVGEKGAELRVLNRGDGIIPADITKNLWKWGELTPEQMINNVAVNGLTGNTSTSTINIDKIILPEVKDGPGFIEYMKNNIGTRSAQLAFSRR